MFPVCGQASFPVRSRAPLRPAALLQPSSRWRLIITLRRIIDWVFVSFQRAWPRRPVVIRQWGGPHGLSFVVQRHLLCWLRSVAMRFLYFDAEGRLIPRDLCGFGVIHEGCYAQAERCGCILVTHPKPLFVDIRQNWTNVLLDRRPVGGNM